jgi:hypothetical protein
MTTYSGDPHPGIIIHKVPVGADVPGLLFAVGMVFIFLLAVPVLCYVLAAGAVLGVVVALALRAIHRLQPYESSYSHLPQLGDAAR